ncbi:hypothetical protein KSP40_PGU006118 [Platanthera guangdongensis]|uniref:Uncharacterized protein n=1 Tax=Platanthera guangdongensis TaxID=2320717 RepID=A0ABR2LQ58_9ASPA
MDELSPRYGYQLELPELLGIRCTCEIKKRTRGPTTGIGWSKRKYDSTEKIEVHLPADLRRFVGDRSQELITRSGRIVRLYAPLNVERWAHIPEKNKKGKQNQWTDEAAKEVYNKLLELHEEQKKEKGEDKLTTKEVYTIVLGKRSGYIPGMGPGPKPLECESSNGKRLKAQIQAEVEAEMSARFQEMEDKVAQREAQMEQREARMEQMEARMLAFMEQRQIEDQMDSTCEIKKRTRGPTTVIGWSKRKYDSTEKIEVHLPADLRRFVGDRSQELITRSGRIVRLYAPLNVERWAHIPEKNKKGKQNQWTDEAAKEVYNKLLELHEEQKKEKGEDKLTTKEVYTIVLGKRSGYIPGMGPGPKPLECESSNGKRLKAQIQAEVEAEMSARFQEMEDKVAQREAQMEQREARMEQMEARMLAFMEQRQIEDQMDSTN